MPTYDYACEECGHTFEMFQTITARPSRKCPACGRMRLKRLIGAGSGLIFKGSGFYQTDYRSESYKKAETTDKGTTAKKAPDKATEAKSADKATEAKSADKSKTATDDKKKSA